MKIRGKIVMHGTDEERARKTEMIEKVMAKVSRQLGAPVTLVARDIPADPASDGRDKIEIGVEP